MNMFPIVAASAMKLPNKVAFSLFGLDVYWFGLLLAVGVIAAILLTYLECRRKELPADTAIDLCLVALPCGIIGARIVYVLFHLSLFKGRALQALYLWDGGLSVIGGVICTLIGLFIYARRKRIRFLRLLDSLTPGVTAALAISAWGHFFNQNFFGPSVANRALKWFPLCVRLDGGEIRLALFFYLFVWLVLVFAYLWFCLRKRAKHDGDATLAFVLLASLAYALLSAVRKDGTGNYLTDQIAGAVLFLAALLFLIVRRVREKRLGCLIWPTPDQAEESDEPDSEAEAPDDEEDDDPTDPADEPEAIEEDTPSTDDGEEPDAADDTASDAE